MISARSRRFLAAMGVAGLQRGLQAGVTLITLPLILHALGTARFGLWAAATSLSWLGAMLDLGLGAALITLVAQAAAAKDFAQMRDALAASLIGAMLMTGAIALVGGALVWMAAAGEEFLILPEATAGAEPSWFGLPLTVRETAPFNRAELVAALNRAKIATRHLFGGNLIRQPYMAARAFRVAGETPNSDVVMNATFWIGVYPGLARIQLDYMLDCISTFCKAP